MQFIRARRAVISNASTWDTVPLLPPDAVPVALQERVTKTPQCNSFMHLHLGIDAKVATIQNFVIICLETNINSEISMD